MIKISNYALTMAILTHRASRTLAACSDGVVSTFSVANADACTYANFVAGLESGCTPADLFPGLNQAEIEAEVADICAYDAITQFVEIQGYYQKDRRFFAGGGPLLDGESWGVEIGQIERFEANMGSRTLIAWPEYLARIDYNNANGLGDNGYPTNMNLDKSCQLKTAMCCFTDDSMGTAFPDGSTTDVCRHDLADSRQSNYINKGWSVFPGSETSTQCVGFTWQEGDDLIGNMMYDVSLRQTALHGYREGIAGAPLCGCVEHMPKVASAQCRTASIGTEITFTFSYDADAGEVSASNEADIVYGDCRGDLATAYKANHADDEDKALIDEYLVGDCAADLTKYLNDEEFLQEIQSDATPGVYDTVNYAEWSDVIVGEGIHFQPPNANTELYPDVPTDTSRAFIEAECLAQHNNDKNKRRYCVNNRVTTAIADAEFRDLIDGSCGDGADRRCIVRRTCPSCQHAFHRDIYYKRLTPLPPAEGEDGGVNMLNLFMNEWKDDIKNTFHVDFELYSTYEDAVAGVNEWQACNFNFDGIGFPRDCGPKVLTGNGWNAYIHHNHGSANHHGFYVEKARA